MMKTGRKKASRAGFMLIELVLAMVILATVLVTLAAMTIQVSKRSLRVTGESYMNAILVREVNRLQTIPYTSLVVGTTTLTETALPFPHTRTITVTRPATNLLQVKIVITPTRTGFRADSITLKRLRSISNTFDTDMPII